MTKKSSKLSHFRGWNLDILAFQFNSIQFNSNHFIFPRGGNCRDS